MVADLPMKKCTCMKKQTHPADSLWSWLVLLCAFLSHVIITGSIASFGVFFPALLAEFKQDKAITGTNGTSWIAIASLSFHALLMFSNAWHLG